MAGGGPNLLINAGISGRLEVACLFGVAASLFCSESISSGVNNSHLYLCIGHHKHIKILTARQSICFSFPSLCSSMLRIRGANLALILDFAINFILPADHQFIPFRLKEDLKLWRSIVVFNINHIDVNAAKIN